MSNKNSFNNRANKKLQELEEFKQADGSYIFKLHIEKETDGVFISKSPDLRGFTNRDNFVTGAWLNGVNNSIKNSLSMNFDIDHDNSDIYFIKDGDDIIIDGSDKYLTLPAGTDYKILVVPKELGVKPKAEPKMQQHGHGCPLYFPAFKK